MSRRRRPTQEAGGRAAGADRGAERPAAGAREAAGRGPSAERATPSTAAPDRRPARFPFGVQVAILVAVFAIVTLVAELAGAANLGVSLGIGSIFFAIALMAVMLEG
jgi:hypothetical protein